MSSVSESKSAVETAKNAALPTNSERAATFLVTFIFAVNVAFVIYMLAQFVFPKPYSTTLHAGYTVMVLAATILLGLSTRYFWMRCSRQGCYAFFAAIGISFVLNLIAGLFA